MKVTTDGTLVKRKEGELNKDGTAVWTWNGKNRFVPVAKYKGPEGAALNSAGTAYFNESSNTWKALPGAISADGTMVYVGDGKWTNASVRGDGRFYFDPLTNKDRPIAGALSKNQTKVYNGTKWENVTMAPDQQSYLNPVTNTYVPVNPFGQDANGKPYVWNLSTNEWTDVPA